MYLTKRIEELKSTEDAFITEDGKSPIFLESSNDEQRYIMAIEGLEKFTQYSVHVQAYNEQGAGPKTEDQTVFTLEDGKVFVAPYKKCKKITPSRLQIECLSQCIIL